MEPSMSSLFDPHNLSDSEFVRIADAHLLTGELPLAWQLNAIDRLGRAGTHYDNPPLRRVPVAVEGAPDGRE
jgi:hypothetical protein